MTVKGSVMKNRDDLRRRIVSETYQFAYRHGVPLKFLADSMTVQDSFDAISERIANLIEEVKLDNLQLKMNRDFEQDKKFRLDTMKEQVRMLEQEIKQDKEKNKKKQK